MLTSVEPDHLDYYGGFDKLVAAFDEYCDKATGGVVASATTRWPQRWDDATAQRWSASSADATSGSLNCASGAKACRSTWCGRGRRARPAVVPVSGAKLASNAAIAAVPALRSGSDRRRRSGRSPRFAGVARRFEHRGEARGVRFVDDYAHLPTEVSAVLEAARSTATGRVVVVFQPHRYSRTAAVWSQFTDAFGDADVLVVTDVYAAGEQPLPGVTGKLIADAVSNAHPELKVIYVPGRGRSASQVAALLRPGDLCLTLGAGDLTNLADELLASTVMVSSGEHGAPLATRARRDRGALGPRATRDAPLGREDHVPRRGRAALLVEAQAKPI